MMKAYEALMLTAKQLDENKVAYELETTLSIVKNAAEYGQYSLTCEQANENNIIGAEVAKRLRGLGYLVYPYQTPNGWTFTKISWR